MEEEIEKFLKQHETCYDRFTFDKIMRFLLKNDYSHEDAKDTILFSCSLSLLVSQERIDNGYYEKIEIDETISADLLDLKSEMTRKYLKGELIKALNSRT